ncbi:hypothetical protein NOVO_07945 [Rickettsiales bacterium Ac37b]|nr:hypothetical protein NOVO_07945 [Rickettsiales bacterium Ac37b]
MKNIGEQAVSVEQILQTIKGVITGDNSKEDVLELTEIVQDGEIDNQKNSIQLEEGVDIKDKKGIYNQSTSGNSEDELIEENSNQLEVKKGKQDLKLSQNNIGNDETQIMTNKNQDSKSLESLNKSPKNVMLSEETVAETSETLKNLVRTVSKPLSDGLSFRNGTSLEDLIIEILKPYLKEWLDSNLPSIVKHIVEKEVQKLIPKDED